MLYLFTNSSKILRYTIENVPDGTTIAAARFSLKTHPELASSSVIDLEITTTIGVSGQVTDTGADGTGQLEFYVGDTDVEGLSTGEWYHASVSVELDNGEIYTVPETIEGARIRPGT